MNQSKPMRYVSELEGFRGLLALWVVLGHWASSLPLRFPVSQSLYNIYAVHVFVLLSGFVITFLLRNSREPYGPYIVRRALRLAPAYFVYLVTSGLMLNFSIEAFQVAPVTPQNLERLRFALLAKHDFLTHIGLHLMAIHALLPTAWLPDAEYTLLGQAWSISLEWQFYAAAPLILGLMTTAWRLTSALALVAVACFCALTAPFMPHGYLGAMLPVFMLGMGSYFVLEGLHNGSLPQSRHVYAASLVLIVCYIVIAKSWSNLPYLLWALMMGVLTINRTGELAVTRSVSRFLDAGPIQLLGRLSYSVYLCHMIPLTAGLYILGQYPLLDPYCFALALLAITLAGTILISAVVYRWIERPAISLGRRLWQPTRSLE